MSSVLPCCPSTDEKLKHRVVQCLRSHGLEEEEESSRGVLAPCLCSQLHVSSIHPFPRVGKPTQAWNSQLRRKMWFRAQPSRPGWTAGSAPDWLRQGIQMWKFQSTKLFLYFVVSTKPQNNTREMPLLFPFLNKDTEAQRDLVTSLGHG